MSEIDVNQLLSQMRAMAAAARGPAPAGETHAAGKPDFSALLKQTVQQVNANQREAKVMSEAFVREDPGVDLTEVMVALQKASISFRAMTEVRNKLVEAYREVMSMQV